MPRPDRSRVPPDVARRLAALTASGAPVARPAPRAAVPAHAPRPTAHAPGATGPGPRATVPAPTGVVPDDVPPAPGPGWTPRPPGVGAAARTTDAPVGRPGGVDASHDAVDAGEPVDRDGAARDWHGDVTTALAAAPRPDPVPDDPPPAPPRVRWAPSWRVVGSAVLVLALGAGGVALRASTAPRGDAVALPTPITSGAPAQGAAPLGTGAGEGAPVPGDDASDGAPGPAGAAPTRSDGADAATQVVVHVVGEVVRPGVVRLGLGARVADALDATGGPTGVADLAAVNLARVLTDGEQLLVPVVGAAPAPGAAPDPGAAAAAAGDGLVDLNRADAATLETLPGVGPVLAGRIVEHRTTRPFTSVDELDDVVGIGPALMADLRQRVRV